MIIHKLNNVFLQIECDDNVAYELHDSLSCYIPNRFFHPKVKAKMWDGKISFFDLRNYTLPIGLLSYLIQFCKKNNYNYEFSFDVGELLNNIKDEELNNFYNLILKDSKYKDSFFSKEREYQRNAVKIALINKRGLLEIGTGGGKSLVIYLIIRFLLALNKKIILIVPTTSLCEQMRSDFKDYGWIYCDDFVDVLYSGKKEIYIKNQEKEENEYEITLENNKKITLNGKDIIKTTNNKMIEVKYLKEGDNINYE